MNDLTPQQIYLLKLVDELRPFEVIEIHKDPTGKPKRFRVIRTQDIIITELEIGGVKI